MAVSVSTDMAVSVTNDLNADKLADRQQALRASVQKGEPKALGVTQIMMGLMVVSYSIPLLYTDFTEVMSSGVTWWSGLAFITAGVSAIVMDKYCTAKSLGVCLLVTSGAILVSIIALVIYFVDLVRHPEKECLLTAVYSDCEDLHFLTKLSRGVKSSLLLFTLVQTVVCSTLTYLLYRERRSYGEYSSLSGSFPTTPTSASPPDLN